MSRIGLLAALFLATACALSAEARADEGFTLRTINETETTTVIGLRPSGQNRQGILDIYPSGAPTYAGKAWIHVCDRDLETSATGFGCAQVMILDTAVRYGFLGAAGVAPRATEIVTGNTKLAVFSLSGGIPRLVAGPFDSLAVAGQMAQMRREMARMSQRLAAAEARVRILERPGVSR